MESAEDLGPLSKLTPGDLDALKKYMDRHIEEVLRARGLIHRLIQDNARTEAVNEALDSVAAKTGTSPEDALLMALTFYDLAVDAVLQGQRLVVVDKDYHFLREVKGLIPKTPEPRSRETVAG
ncbi:MAG TPA: hypothetical protein VG406_04825 [Isosphaeraceae bacterium]|jgi:hypothetical protein|nr:hypothetical protein [Isosphaeraceae bacterium]